MKPVLILQNLSADGPAYLGSWLRRRGLPHVVLDAQAGEAFPQHMSDYSALALLGGEMSANDALHSLRRAEVLILDAMARDRPVIGHCLGAQLMARALGAKVGPPVAPEIGWQPMEVADTVLARAWLGEAGPRHVFQWHEEAFALPPQAHALATSAACTHQAFAIGPHIATQFHVEVDEDKVRRWAMSDSPHYLSLQRRFHTVQSGSAMCEALRQHLPSQLALADRIYARWVATVVG